MTRSPNMKDHNVDSSPVKPTASAPPAKPTIPKLKLSLKLSATQPQTDQQQQPLPRLDENTKPGLPKITLSVRKAAVEERIDIVETKSLLPTAVTNNADTLQEPPKRKRGRPPKNPQTTETAANGHIQKREFTKTSKLPSLGRPPTTMTHKYMSPTISSASTSSHNLSLDTRSAALKGPLTAHTTIGDAELAKIGRLKGHLATFIESDVEAINHADYRRPFSSKQDMIERLLPFHLLSMADIQVYIPPNPNGLSMENVGEEMEKMRLAFQTLIHSQNQQTIPTELRLLEQRLCLEEEKFLLEKMRSEYKRRLNGGQ